MKKNLILFTALFAGTMIISNDICAGNILNQNNMQGDRKRTNDSYLNAQNSKHKKIYDISRLMPQLEDIKNKINNVDGKIFYMKGMRSFDKREDFVNSTFSKLLNLKINDNEKFFDIIDAYFKERESNKEGAKSTDIISNIINTIANCLEFKDNEIIIYFDNMRVYFERFYSGRIELFIEYPFTGIEDNYFNSGYTIAFHKDEGGYYMFDDNTFSGNGYDYTQAKYYNPSIKNAIRENLKGSQHENDENLIKKIAQAYIEIIRSDFYQHKLRQQYRKDIRRYIIESKDEKDLEDRIKAIQASPGVIKPDVINYVINFNSKKQAELLKKIEKEVLEPGHLDDEEKKIYLSKCEDEEDFQFRKRVIKACILNGFAEEIFEGRQFYGMRQSKNDVELNSRIKALQLVRDQVISKNEDKIKKMMKDDYDGCQCMIGNMLRLISTIYYCDTEKEINEEIKFFKDKYKLR